MSDVRRAPILLAALIAAAGCTEPRSTSGSNLGTATLVGGAADGSDVTVDVALCVRCHGDAARAVQAGDAAGVQLAPPVDVSRSATGDKVGAHLAHVRAGPLHGTGVECGACHVTPANPANHVPGVSMRALAATAWPGAPAIAPAYAGGSCSSTYCHGAFPGGVNATVTWTGAGGLGCTSCHGFPPAVQSDGTTAHPNNTSCGSCHEGYGLGVVNPLTHVNGEIDGGCTGCHGTQGRPDGGIAGVTYDANEDAAPPLDADGNGSGVLVGAHLAHVNPTPSVAGGTEPSGGVRAPIACTECHPDNTTQAHPDNAQAQVTFALATGADLDGYSPSRVLGNGTSTATTCSTYCHDGVGGGSVGTWSWSGAAATCGSCHGFPPASHGALTSSTQCATCHGDTVASDGTIDIAGGRHIDGVVQASGCTGCHGTDTRPNGDMALPYDANQNAAPPVDTNGASTGVLVGAHLAHVNPSTATGVYGPIACTECHPNNTSGGHPDNAQAEVIFALATGADLAGFTPAATLGDGSSTPTTCTTYCHNGPAAAGYGGSASAWSWTGGAATCASCHGDPPATAGHAGLDASSDCGGCHPGYTATTVNLDTHINGQLDGGESIGALACSGCHASIFTAMSTAGAASRHALTLDGPTDTAVTWSSPLATAVLPASRSCVNMCHGDHPHDLVTPLVTTHEYNVYLDATSQATRGGSTRTSATRARTDFVIGEANGGLCTSCHRNPVSAGRPTVTAASYGATAHDFTTFTAGTTWTWSFQLHSGTFNRNCTKCHASATEGTTPSATANSSNTTSVHYNANPSLLAGKLNPSGTAAGFVCYNCHGATAAPTAGNQGNRSGKNIQTQVAKTYRHPAVDDAVHDSVDEYANAAFGNALGGATRHASCMDCHAPHEARAGTHAAGTAVAGPPLHGAWGAALSSNPGFWAAPTSTNFTKKVIAAGTDLEATLCFKCHSSFYGTLPTSPTGGFAGTDTAREFNPANVGNFAGTWASGETAGGFHPVLADAGANLGRVNLANLVTTNIAWSTTSRNRMTCTDCHESDTATDPNGPHGSAAGFLLKGPNTTWSASVVMTSSGMPAGTFCRNCHSPTFASSRFTQHYSRSDHRVACFKCHAAIPHGGPRPGMLAAGAGAAAAVGGVIAGWDQTSPYWQGGTGSRLYIHSYPTSGTAAWVEANCGCNGTGH